MAYLHHRRSIRLAGYDYSQAGAYFVTIVTAGQIERFGTVCSPEMRLNSLGEIIANEWRRLPGRFNGLEMDAFVVMPNHLHGVLVFHPPEDAPGCDKTQPSQVNTGSLGAVMRTFKSSTTLRFHRLRGLGAGLLWQRNYYEHIVRNTADLERIRTYILENPVQWEQDRENSQAKGNDHP